MPRFDDRRSSQIEVLSEDRSAKNPIAKAVGTDAGVCQMQAVKNYHIQTHMTVNYFGGCRRIRRALRG